MATVVLERSTLTNMVTSLVSETPMAGGSPMAGNPAYLGGLVARMSDASSRGQEMSSSSRGHTHACSDDTHMRLSSLHSIT